MLTGDGAALYVRCYGDRHLSPVVLIHGFGASIEYWQPQIDELAQRHWVIAYDQRGLGRSSMGSAGVRPEVLADDLAAVLALTLGEGRRAVLVGHSFGAVAVMAFAGRHADQMKSSVAAALLANTAAGGFPDALVGVGKAVGSAAVPMPPLALWRCIFQWVTLSRHADRDVVDYLYRIISRCGSDIRGIWADGVAGLDVVAGVLSIAVPTTVIVGSEDVLTPRRYGQFIAGILRGTGALYRYVEYPRAGHSSSLEMPREFSCEIERLIALPG